VYGQRQVIETVLDEPLVLENKDHLSQIDLNL